MNPLASQFAQVGDMIRLIIQFVDQNGVIISLVGASTLTLKIEYPDGSTVDKTATLLTDGTDGKIYYDTLRTDLNASGYYRLQGEATLSGETFSTRNSEQDDNVLLVYSNVDNN